jgi:KAP-like P-loop domain-containing protein
MWADNETRIDLLGFDYLVDSLEVVLTQPRLLPVAVGVLGDWGSGKSSLLRMVADRLAQAPDYVVVPFSPWRYEAYEDVKAALMDAVLTQLAARVPKAADPGKSEGLLRRLRAKVGRLMVGPAAAGRVMVPLAGAMVAVHEGLPPEVGTAAGAAVLAGVDAVKAHGEDAEPPQEPPVFESVADFRLEFEALLESLQDVKATIVLIDDLDRCLDDTVIDVFEAIRLFLQVSSTAFVIAANRAIVQAAVERRYPAKVEGDPALGKDYLEKIIQVEINIPPLAEPEAETYLNLLFADLRLDEAAMQTVRAEAVKRRQQNQLSVAMNYGIAKGVLAQVPNELEADFTIANRIAPTLSRGLRGNPRQLKRFLNTMLLRLETARRRGVELDSGVLAKLMVLERQEAAFQQLFLWQLNQDGAPEEISVAEACAISGEALPSGASTELQGWFGSAVVRQWLELEPRLAGLPLGQYFFFSRDRLSPAAPGARLSAPLQALLGRLQLTPTAQRRAAVDEAAKLGPEEYASIYDALLDRAKRKPGGEAMDSLVELTDKVPASWPALGIALGQIPPNDIPPKLPLTLALLGKDRPEVAALLDQWEASTVPNLAKAVGQARKAPT